MNINKWLLMCGKRHKEEKISAIFSFIGPTVVFVQIIVAQHLQIIYDVPPENRNTPLSSTVLTNGGRMI